MIFIKWMISRNSKRLFKVWGLVEFDLEVWNILSQFVSSIITYLYDFSNWVFYYLLLISVAMVGVQEAQAYKTCGKSRRIIVICICTCICSWTPQAGLLYDFLLRSSSGFRSPKISVFHVGTFPLTSLPACRITTASFITLGHQP